MWLMFVIAMGSPSYGQSYANSVAITQAEFQTREACIAAVNFSKKRAQVADAWCVKK